MPERVTHEGEVSLNAVKYRLAKDPETRTWSRVRSNFIEWPEKQVFGDRTKDSHRNISTAAWSDFSQGMGLERMESHDTKKSWWSTVDQDHARRVTLPPLATQTEAMAGGSTGNILINELDGTIMCAVGTDIQSYSGSAWTSRGTAPAAPTDVLNFNLDASGTRTEYLAFACTSNYAYADNPTGSWTNASGAKPVVKLAYWDDKLWGIDADGLLWYTRTIGGGNEVNDAQLPLSHGDAITSLFEGVAPNGRDTILYCTTKKWLYQHDYGNRRWIRTKVSLPANLAASGITKQAASYQSMICLGANTGFKLYKPWGDAFEKPILLGHDDGLKNTKEGRVFCMAESIADLIIGTNVVNSTDSAAIFKWNDQNGFRVLWEATTTGTAGNIESLHVSDAITNYRCYFGYADRVWWIRLHDSVANPKQVEGWTFTDRDISDTNPIILETPWFNADQEEITKVILRSKVESEGCSANEAIRVRYGTDYSTTWTQFTDTHTSDTTFDATDDRIEGDGITTFSFPSVAAPTGSSFRAIRFELALRRGTTNTNAPIMVSLWIEYLKVQPDKWSFEFDVDVSEGYSGNSSAAQRAALITAIESDALVEFTYRDDDGNDRNFYVKVHRVHAEEDTGRNEKGILTLRADEI